MSKQCKCRILSWRVKGFNFFAGGRMYVAVIHNRVLFLFKKNYNEFMALTRARLWLKIQKKII